MYNTSTAYKTEIKKPSRSFECKVTIGNNIYTNDDIVDIILDTVQPQEGFSIGNTPSQTLDLTLLNKGDIIYSTNQVKVEIGLKISDKIEYVLIGYFNIDDIEKTDYTTKITAYDNMIKFETSYFSSLVDTPTLQQVVNELSSKTGVQFTGSLPAYTVSKLEGFTCREVLGYVASLCGGNALITRDGKFTVVYPKDINYSISADNYFDYKREEIKYKIGKVSCKSEDKELNKGSLGTDSMELQFENPWVNESILNDIYTKLNGFTYLGYTMKWQGDLSLDIGDIITCTDTKGIVRKLPILSQKFTYTGGLTTEIGAKGETKNKNSFNSSGSNTKKLERVVMEQALIKDALIDVAHIGDLTAGKIKVDILEGGTAILQNIITNFISGESGQFMHLTGANVVIDNAVIKDAMIESLNVSKINAGDISTNKFRIKSDNGGIEIVGATQQFKDKNNKVRIQMGQDTQGSFNFILRGEDGTTTLIDHNGIKEKAIADDLIKGNMISENAVGGKQIDYNSFTEEFNKDTNTHTLKSSKVLLDETNQTLDIAFNTLKTEVESLDLDGLKESVTANTTYLNVQQGKIDTLISNTTIVKDGKTIQLKDSYNSTVATVDSMTNTIGEHKSTIDALTGEVTGMDTKVNTVHRDLDGVKTTVSNATTTANSALSKATEAKQTADGFSQRVGNIETNYATTTAMNSAITQSATGIKSEVSNTFVSKSDASITYATKTSLTQTEDSIVAKFTSSGGYNLLKNSAFANKDTVNWSLGGNWNRYPTYTSTYYTEYGCIALYPVSTSNTRGLIGQTLSENLKKNTKYTFSLKTFWEKNITEVNLYMDYTKNGAYVANTIHKFSSSYDRQSYTFTSPNVDFDTVKFYVEIKSNGVSGNWVARVIKPCLCEGDIAVWSPHPGELIDGYTQIDGNGVTIYDGALTVKNRLGQDVLVATVAGNLNMIGMITTYNNDMTKRQIELIRNDINFYDWETAANNLSIGRIYTGKQVVNGLAISTPALSIRNTPASYISISSERSMLMHFDDYNRSTYSGHIPIWFYKNAIMGNGASMYFNMPVSTGQIFGGSDNKLVLQAPQGAGQGIQVQSNSGSVWANIVAGNNYPGLIRVDTYIDGKLAVSGSKNSIQKTKSYGERLINAYETAEYYYGDLGFGIINEDGECLMALDDIFLECVNTKQAYHVFTQVYNGSINKIERYETYIIVKGVPKTEFSWQVMAKRIGYENHRLETPNDFDKTESYENMFNRHFEEFEAEKTTERQSVEGDMYTNDTLAGDMLVTELDFKLDDFLLNKEEI
jgi:hypothetical protein